MSTEIQWTDETWNPVRGCSRVSDGCTNCYAMGQAHRFSGPGKPYEGLTTIRRGKVDWVGKARLVPEMLDAPLRWKKPRRIFVNSMSDLFHESLSEEDIDRVFAIMARCPQHTFQILTKRPKRMVEYFADTFGRSILWCETDELREAQSDVDGFDDNKTEADLRLTRQNEEGLSAVHQFGEGVPLPNVWLGVSAEDQKTADERIPLLLQCPAAVRFVSAEPLLGPVDLSRFMWPVCAQWPAAYDSQDEAKAAGAEVSYHRQSLVSAYSRFIDWVIVGGESGHGARPCNVEWIRSIVRQCGEAGVACFVKQLGAKPAGEKLGEFDSFQRWVNHARSWIGGTGAMCFDTKMRLCAIGRDMMRARDEDTFPVSYHLPLDLNHKKGADPSEWLADLRAREFPKPKMA